MLFANSLEQRLGLELREFYETRLYLRPDICKWILASSPVSLLHHLRRKQTAGNILACGFGIHVSLHCCADKLSVLTNLFHKFSHLSVARSPQSRALPQVPAKRRLLADVTLAQMGN